MSIFIGYSTSVKNFKLWYPNLERLKFVICRDVIIDGLFMLQHNKKIRISLLNILTTLIRRWSLR